MVCPAFNSSHSSGNEDIPYITVTDDHIIDKVLLFGSGVHPRSLVLVCDSEYRVGDAKSYSVHLFSSRRPLAFRLPVPCLPITPSQRL